MINIDKDATEPILVGIKIAQIIKKPTFEYFISYGVVALQIIVDDGVEI